MAGHRRQWCVGAWHAGKVGVCAQFKVERRNQALGIAGVDAGAESEYSMRRRERPANAKAPGAVAPPLIVSTTRMPFAGGQRAATARIGDPQVRSCRSPCRR